MRLSAIGDRQFDSALPNHSTGYIDDPGGVVGGTLRIERVGHDDIEWVHGIGSIDSSLLER